MNIIIDPVTNKKYKIFSKQGKQILKKLINTHKGGMFRFRPEKVVSNELPNKGKRLPMTEEDKERNRTFLMIANRMNTRNDAETLEKQPVDSIRNLSNIQQNIVDGVQDEFESIKIVFNRNRDVIQTMSARLHESSGHYDYPYKLEDFEYFSDDELNKLRMNNITTMIELTGKYFSGFNSNLEEDELKIPIMKIYNFLKPLFDYDGDDVRRAIRILAIIDYIGSKAETTFPYMYGAWYY